MADEKILGTRQTVAYKTVDIFSGITGKNLVLKEGREPQTNGREIEISFHSDNYYQDLEHELAHVLFGTDVLAVNSFVKEYSERIATTLEKQGEGLSPTELGAFKDGVFRIINITEDHRVNSLWGLLYAGSYEIIRQQDKDSATRGMLEAHKGVVNFYAVLSGGVDPGPGGS